MLDKVPKVIFGKKTLISIYKSKADLEVKNGKQMKISRALRVGKAQARFP